MAQYLSNPNVYNYAPSPSPPSSPIPWESQSLPPSDDEQEVTSPWRLASDPYSANAKATHSPLTYTRTKRQLYATPLTPSSSFASYEPISPSPAPRSNIPTPIRAQSKYTPIGDPTWDEVLNDAFHNGTSIIDLDNSNVKTVPREIIDLNDMVSLQSEAQAPLQHPPIQHPETPSRSNIASAAARSRRILSQSQSSNSLFSSGTPTKSRRELQIYMANNSITVLPSELFELKGLTLLSLRGNQLRELPPAIGNLRSLRSLNVASNELTYLPAEISHLTLQTLLLDPNPFLPRPSPDNKPAYRTQSTFPKLAELALRVALLPSRQQPRITPILFPKDLSATQSLLTPTDSRSSVFSSSVLSRPLPRPYDTHPFPPHTLAISETYDMASWISGNVTGNVHIAAAMQGTQDALELYSWCPAPKHRQDSGGLFVQPAEERLEWVTVLAGCKLSSAVPVLWRGCSAGCLNFLYSQERDEDEEFIGSFGGGDGDVVLSEVEHEEAMVEAQTQIIWDDIMDLDD